MSKTFIYDGWRSSNRFIRKIAFLSNARLQRRAFFQKQGQLKAYRGLPKSPWRLKVDTRNRKIQPQTPKLQPKTTKIIPSIPAKSRKFIQPSKSIKLAIPTKITKSSKLNTPKTQKRKPKIIDRKYFDKLQKDLLFKTGGAKRKK